jgi:hypothetical protein
MRRDFWIPAYRRGDADLGDMHRILPVVFPVESIFPGQQCPFAGMTDAGLVGLDLPPYGHHLWEFKS